MNWWFTLYLTTQSSSSIMYQQDWGIHICLKTELSPSFKAFPGILVSLQNGLLFFIAPCSLCLTELDSRVVKCIYTHICLKESLPHLCHMLLPYPPSDFGTRLRSSAPQQTHGPTLGHRLQVRLHCSKIPVAGPGQPTQAHGAHAEGL